MVYLVRQAGISLVDAGLILSVAQGGGICGRVVWGWVADKWIGPRAMLLILGGVMAASAIVTGWLAPILPMAVLLPVVALFGATAIGWNGVFLAEVAHLAPKGRAGEATGGALFFTFAGVVFGPSLFGLAVEGLPGGYASAFTVFGVAALGGGVLSGLAARLASPRDKETVTR